MKCVQGFKMLKLSMMVIGAFIIMLLPSVIMGQSLGYYGSALWNGANDVEVSGNYAYCAYEEGLLITTAASAHPPSMPPTLVSKVYFDGEGMGVCVSGNYAYLADGIAGIQIINISTPSSPSNIGNYNTPDFARSVVINGDYAYVADLSSGLLAVNVSDKANPSLTGYYDSPGEACDLVISGSYAYLADGSEGLKIVNISNPASLSLTGSCNTSGKSIGICLSGNYAFIADSGNGLVIMNVSDPSNPTIVNTISTGVTRHVFVINNYAHVISDYNGIMVYNVTDPLNPTGGAYYALPVFGKRVFVTVPDNVHYYCHIADDKRGLWVIDASNHAAPCSIGVYDNGYSSRIFASGSYAYVGDKVNGSNNLKAVNISDPANPAIYTTRSSMGGVVNGLFVSGSYLYTVEGSTTGSYRYYSTPGLTYVGGASTSGGAKGIFVSGSYAYIANGTAGLQIINKSNSSIVGNYDTPGSGEGVFVSGQYAFIADGSSGLRIISVADPTNPFGVGHYQTAGSAKSVAVSGDYAYVADGDFRVIDILNPYSPSLTSSVTTDGDAYWVSVSGSYAYIADGSYGVMILNISNPKYPYRANSPWKYNSPKDAQCLSVSGSYVYTADYYSMLALLPVFPSNTGTISGTVYNSNNVPLSGVQVSIQAGPSSGSTTTNGSGYYSLSSLLVGYYNVSFHLDGYGNETSENIEVTNGGNTTLNQSLTPGCIYVLGDMNGNGTTGGEDVTYGTRYLRGLGNPPPDSCFMDSTSTFLYVAADCNGNCEFRGSDVTRLVAYFQGGTPLANCHWFPTAK